MAKRANGELVRGRKESDAREEKLNDGRRGAWERVRERKRGRGEMFVDIPGNGECLLPL